VTRGDEMPPDTKDWTWVIERPCADCGFDPSALAERDIAATLRDCARRWVAELSREGVAVRTRPDRWSVLEYGCHVRDTFEVFDHRLVRMLEEDDPLFENWDQDATALERRYALEEPGAVAADLVDAAATLAARFDRVDALAWQRPGTRSNGSRFTVWTLGVYLVHDPVHHLWDVNAGRGHLPS
jgi:hypothetical protein